MHAATTQPPVAPSAAARPPLSQVIPPLVLGTATFNTQYHPNPSLNNLSLPVLARALELGVRAIDTSPYYGPSELLLGAAMRSLGLSRPDDGDSSSSSSSSTTTTTPEETNQPLFIITKAGRVGPSAFDYTPAHIRHSVRRSLRRLGVSRLDLVHCHDVEFVDPPAVVAAVRELRRLRDEEGLLRYVGISGYPVPVLAALAERVLRETGEPLDAVQSYSHYCAQNDALGGAGALARFARAGVGVVTNASMLSMGLLTTRGADAGPQASWHPAPRELRRRCRDLGALARARGEGLEDVALRWALAGWARRGAALGTAAGAGAAASSSSLSTEETAAPEAAPAGTTSSRRRIGVSVMGVTRPEELDETWRAWKDVVRVLELEDAQQQQQQQQQQSAQTPVAPEDAAVVARAEKIRHLVEEEMRPALGPDWVNYSWDSPGEGFVNTRREFGVLPEDYDHDHGEGERLVGSAHVEASEATGVQPSKDVPLHESVAAAPPLAVAEAVA